MELMELVEGEPTTRPFQCDWESCIKVRSHPRAGPLGPWRVMPRSEVRMLVAGSPSH